MKMNKLAFAAIAASVIGLSTSVASAAGTVTASQNDLLIGFQDINGNGTSGTNVPTDLEIDLGSVTNFEPGGSDYTGAVITLPQLVLNDLTTIYGSNWANANSGVNWSVAGTGTGASTFLDTQTIPLTDNSSSALNPVVTAINTFRQGLNGATALSDSSTGAAIGNSTTPAANITNSYTYTETQNGNSAGFGYSSNDEQTGAGTDELYLVSPGTSLTLAQDLGTFKISSSGVLTFQSQAVPEPSAYALGICAVVLFWVLKRRSKVA